MFLLLYMSEFDRLSQAGTYDCGLKEEVISGGWAMFMNDQRSESEGKSELSLE